MPEHRAIVRRWVTWITVLLLAGSSAVIFGPVGWRVIQSSRPCASPYVLDAVGPGIVAVEPAVEDWHDVLTEAGAHAPSCLTLEVTGSTTMGQISAVMDAAEPEGVRVRIQNVD